MYNTLSKELFPIPGAVFAGCLVGAHPGLAIEVLVPESFEKAALSHARHSHAKLPLALCEAQQQAQILTPGA